jgi:CRP-like cAMP-binding protein
MIAKFLKNVFDPILELDIQVWQNFEKLGVIEKFPKETVLKYANTTEKYYNLVIEGSGGNLIWKENNFICVDISFENHSLTDYMSFISQKPTPIEIRLFEDSTIFRISHGAFKEIFETVEKGEKLIRLIAETYYTKKQQQQIDLLTKTVKERYLHILATKKGIERTQLKYIASFLGITPQSLSRIRAEKIWKLP